jgi:hypothetical protein
MILPPHITSRDLVLMTCITAALRMRAMDARNGHAAHRFGQMCNLYSITTNQAAIIALFRVMN